jgi:malate synthase
MVEVGGLRVASDLFAFVSDEALPGTGVDENAFWTGADRLIHTVTPQIRALLARRVELQNQIDSFYDEGAAVSAESSEAFLRSIGYIAPEPEDFQITTSGVDPEISEQPGPQLVVPLLNARFATNAANARWGSLYDALYGSDVIPEDGGRARGRSYNPVRGEAVVARGRAFLDEHFPLQHGSHRDGTGYTVAGGRLMVRTPGGDIPLAESSSFLAYRGTEEAPEAILLVNHGLHVEIQIDRQHMVGSSDAAGVRDILLEAAVTAIMDLEDSVAAVDCADKLVGYRNWLGLMQGTLAAEVDKDGRTFTRRLNQDRVYRTPAGAELSLPGRALLLVRHVGHHMSTNAVLDRAGDPVPEGVLDALITGLASVHDLRGPGAGANSRAGAVYVVKPKLHGPEEVTLACQVFAEVERILNLAPWTIKIGVMDEERRTSVNLKGCIRAARDRIAFINTGFLDRTGDEIHTSMHAGPMVRKADMRESTWLVAYEERNVDIGLACGFLGRAQIGKGMWAAPDNLAEMLDQKIAHPRAGATCAWVPSPTAATLHALHYHQVDVFARQRELAAQPRGASLTELLTAPIGDPAAWSDADCRAELDNNVQSTLGYVVRWINSGVGCSKVPDIHGTALMEDRATCRISSQLVANWLKHGVISLQEIDESMRRIALIVDEQNEHQPDYEPLAHSWDGEAFNAARALLVEGAGQPCGYTEPILHRYRIAKKGSPLDR